MIFAKAEAVPEAAERAALFKRIAGIARWNGGVKRVAASMSKIRPSTQQRRFAFFQTANGPG
jgi:hypothetical protein